MFDAIPDRRPLHRGNHLRQGSGRTPDQVSKATPKAIEMKARGYAGGALPAGPGGRVLKFSVNGIDAMYLDEAEKKLAAGKAGVDQRRPLRLRPGNSLLIPASEKRGPANGPPRITAKLRESSPARAKTAGIQTGARVPFRGA